MWYVSSGKYFHLKYVSFSRCQGGNVDIYMRIVRMIVSAWFLYICGLADWSSISSGQLPFSQQPRQLFFTPQGLVLALWLNVHKCKYPLHRDWTYLFTYCHISISIYINTPSNVRYVFTYSHLHGRLESDGAPSTYKRRNQLWLN